MFDRPPVLLLELVGNDQLRGTGGRCRQAVTGETFDVYFVRLKT
jgi:hypothetical protein